MKERLLTVADVANMLRLQDVTVRNMANDGTLPSVRTGRAGKTVRFESEDIANYIRGRRVGPRLEHYPQKVTNQVRRLLCAARAAKVRRKNEIIEEITTLLDRKEVGSETK